MKSGELMIDDWVYAGKFPIKMKSDFVYNIDILEPIHLTNEILNKNNLKCNDFHNVANEEGFRLKKKKRRFLV